MISKKKMKRLSKTICSWRPEVMNKSARVCEMKMTSERWFHQCTIRSQKKIPLDELKITQFRLEEDQNMHSNWIKLQRMHFTQNGVERTWDIALTADSVSCLIYHKTRKCFMLVKQFRPALFARQVLEDNHRPLPKTQDFILPEKPEFTFELCAGLSDKDLPPEATIQAEIEEECGYRIPLEHIQRINSFFTGTASNASVQHMFYVEMDDNTEKNWKVSEGGGVAEEGENIEVYKLPLQATKNFLVDASIVKPSTLIYALTWWFLEKASPEEQQKYYFQSTSHSP